MLDHAKRFAGVANGSASNLNEIDGDAMKRGLAFADYQIALSARFMPEDAFSYLRVSENGVTGLPLQTVTETNQQAGIRFTKKYLFLRKIPRRLGRIIRPP